MFLPSSFSVFSLKLIGVIISEAPDIRNWFSSYAYESPATLGLGCDFHDLVASEEGIDGEKDKIIEVTENPIDSSDDNDVVCVERPSDKLTKVSGKLAEDSDQEFHQEVFTYVPKLKSIQTRVLGL